MDDYERIEKRMEASERARHIGGTIPYDEFYGLKKSQNMGTRMNKVKMIVHDNVRGRVLKWLGAR